MRRMALIGVLIGLFTLTAEGVSTRSQDPSRTLSPDARDPFGNTVQQVFRAQASLIAAADRLTLFMRAAGARANVAGYSSIELDVEAQIVRLYWKTNEPVPVALEDLVHGLTRDGVVVSVEPAPYSQADLNAEAERLLKDTPAGSITEVSLLPMASGLSVQFNAAIDSPAAREGVSAMRSRLARKRSAWFGSPAENDVILSRGGAKRPFSRHDDAAPWKGGAEITAAEGGCSTGFAVGSWFGRYMLTAGHCVLHHDNILVRDGVGQLMGYSEGARDAKLQYRDSALIRLSTRNIGRIYDGGVDIGEFTKPVKGPVGSYLNQYVCTSGAFSGARCDIKVVSTLAWTYDIFGRKFGPMVKARQIDGRNASGEGDSGGPVFALNAQSNVLAAGIINAGDVDASAPCTGIVYDSRYGSRVCGSVVYYTPIWTLLDGHGVWLETN